MNINQIIRGILILCIVGALMYLGMYMFYNTGLTLTDLDVHKSDANDNSYDVSYLMRSVRGFNKVVSQHTLLTNDNNILGENTQELSDIKDGSFQMQDHIKLDTQEEAAKIEIALYEIDESGNQKEMYNQTFDIQ